MDSPVLRSVCGLVLLGVATQCAVAAAGPRFLTQYHLFDPGMPQTSELADLDADGKPDIVVLTKTDPGILVRLGDGAGDFETKTFLPTPHVPHACAVAHINVDSHLDIVVSHATLSALSVFYGNGDGTFAAPIGVTVGSLPTAIAVGDLNEDGRNDLVVGCQGTDQLWVLFGLIDQVWFPVVQVPAELDPIAVSLADLNKDDHLDVVYVNQTSETIASRLGDGTGALSAPNTASGYPGMRDLLVADLDQDTILDVATTNGDQGSVGVFLGIGEGSFQSPVTWPVGLQPRGLTVMHANADAIPDLVTGLSETGRFAILPGAGNGTFDPPVEIYAGATPLDVAAGDIDGDTKQDLAVTNTNGVSIHRSTGDATFGFTPPTIPFDGLLTYAILEDLDVDGNLDLITATRLPSRLAIRWGLGNGAFEPGPTLTDVTIPLGIAIGDLNGDGWLDLVTANSGSGNASVFVRTGPRTYAFTGNVPVADYPNTVRRVALEHFDTDERLDLVVLTWDHVSIYRGLGQGAFGSPMSQFMLQSHSADDDLDIADVNLDGHLDVLATHTTCCPSNVWQFLGNGDGSVQPGTLLRSEDVRFAALAAGLLTGDASPDLAVAVFPFGLIESHPVEILAGNGNGTYGQMSDSPSSSDPQWVEVVDLDRDSKADLLVANGTLLMGNIFSGRPGSLSFHAGRGDGTFEMRVDYGLDSRPTQIVPGDLNRDGALDLVITVSSQVLVLLNQHGTPTDAGDVVPVRDTDAQLRVLRAGPGIVRIEYDIGGAAASPVTLQIFDVRGRRVRSLEIGMVAPGLRSRIWDGRDDAGASVARGVYWVSLRTSTANLQRKIVRLER